MGNLGPRVFYFIITILGSFFLLSCGDLNLLEEFGDKDTDEAIFYDAKILVNDSKFSEAIGKFETLSTAYQAKREVLVWHASAYAGLCGLDFMGLLQSLENIGTDKLFMFLMKTYSGGDATNVTNCESAEALIKSISATATERTVDENLLMIFLSWVKIGHILSIHADTDNNDTPEATFDSCSSADISDDYIKGVGTGFANMMTSLDAISASSSIGSDQLGPASDLCAALPAAYNFCNNTEKSDFDTADEIKGVRTLIKEDRYLGLGADCDGEPLPGQCICP